MIKLSVQGTKEGVVALRQKIETAKVDFTKGIEFLRGTTASFNDDDAAACSKYMDEALAAIGNIWWPLYNLENFLDRKAKAEAEAAAKAGNDEVARLTRELEEHKEKVRSLFSLDEQNCELKRKLRELEAQVSGVPIEDPRPEGENAA